MLYLSAPACNFGMVPNFFELPTGNGYQEKTIRMVRTEESRLPRENFDHIQTLAECRNATHYKYNPEAPRLRSEPKPKP